LCVVYIEVGRVFGRRGYMYTCMWHVVCIEVVAVAGGRSGGGVVLCGVVCMSGSSVAGSETKNENAAFFQTKQQSNNERCVLRSSPHDCFSFLLFLSFFFGALGAAAGAGQGKIPHAISFPTRLASHGCGPSFMARRTNSTPAACCLSLNLKSAMAAACCLAPPPPPPPPLKPNPPRSTYTYLFLLLFLFLLTSLSPSLSLFLTFSPSSSLTALLQIWLILSLCVCSWIKNKQLPSHRLLPPSPPSRPRLSQ
jgi:hypothetical protein